MLWYPLKNHTIYVSIADLAGLRSSGKTNCFSRANKSEVVEAWSRDVAQDARSTDRQAQRFLAFGKFLLANRKVLNSLLVEMFQEEPGSGKETCGFWDASSPKWPLIKPAKEMRVWCFGR